VLGALLCGVEEFLIALPLAAAIETMRPLPTTPIAGAPSFVLGVAVIRGVATVVVDAGLLLNGRSSAPERYVTMRVGERVIALAVKRVIGTRVLPEARELPPLLRDGPAAAIAALDAELMVVLSELRVVPEDVFARVEATR